MYFKLFNINTLHNYYKSGICNSLIITPTSECKKIIKNHRLLFKNTVKGFQISYSAKNESGDPLIELSDLLFTCIITSNNYAELLNKTDLDVKSVEYSGNKIIYFRNDPITTKSIKHKFIDYIKPRIFNYKFPFKAKDLNSDTASLELLNNEGNTVMGPFQSIKPGNDKCYYQYIDLSAFPDGKYIFRVSDTNNSQKDELICINNELSKQVVFGLLEIEYNSNTLKEYDLTFIRQNSVWKYFVVNKSGIVDLDSYSLEIKDTSKEKDIPYKKVNVFNKGKEPDPDIRIDGYDTVTFTSNDKIPFYERPLLYIELLKIDKTGGSSGDKITLIKHLPNPKISGIINKNKESEIYVFI